MVRDTILHIQPPVEGDGEMIVTLHDPRRPPSSLRMIPGSFSNVVTIAMDAYVGDKPMLVLVETVGAGEELIYAMRKHGVRAIPVNPSDINRN